MSHSQGSVESAATDRGLLSYEKTNNLRGFYSFIPSYIYV